MKAVFYFLIVLACVGVAASTTSPTTSMSTETSPTSTGTATGSSNPAVTGSTVPTTPSGAANVYCSVSVTMAVAALAFLRL